MFTEEQVNRLFQLAIERQEADKQHRYDNLNGLTLQEIERIASEVGIDPRYVRLALSDIHRPKEQSFERGIWGSPRIVEITKEIPGRLSDTALADIFAEIRSSNISERGQFEKFANKFEWKTPPGSGLANITITGEPWEENTALTLEADLTQAQALIHFLPSFLPLFLGFIMTVTGRFPAALPVAIAVVGALFFFLRWGMTQFYKSKKREYEALMDRLASLAIERHEQISNWTYEDPEASPERPVVSLDDSNLYAPDSTRSAAERKKMRS